jgi:hypothetical protein
MNRIIFLIIASLLTVSVVSGCSFSASSKSSSNLISSPFKSSSNGTKEATYESDAAAYTVAFVSSKNNDVVAFRNGLAKIADTYGVSDWEGNAHSWVSIGRGLKAVDYDNVKVSIFSDLLSASEIQKQLIWHGYNGTEG